ncbi:putative RNA helicase [Tilletia horrida]|uniref:RNA helicase n=1 Tax=Tilletia horrida TaxID=155126 RepID=A0AAN6JKP7_9BASI|nr:putative RNA helicase [Tilletia horrida]
MASTTASTSASASAGSEQGVETLASPPALRSFAELSLHPSLTRSLAALAITTPTPIQALTIPHILRGRDVIGGARTGSGKTLAFALPILHQLTRDMVGGFAIVLTPTRELGVQLHEQFVAVAAGAASGSGLAGLRCALVLGGMDMQSQATELARGLPHVIVATPGRLCDLLRSEGDGAYGLQRCKFVVLDEADRLLTPTFAPELQYLFSVLPPARQRQTLLFTATLTAEVEQLVKKKPAEGKEPPLICKIEGELKDDEGDDDDDRPVPPTIIFTARCRTAALLSKMLEELGIASVALHSRLTQPQRLANLATFRAQRVKLLIATDVASRGLDVPEVRMVVNWDLPLAWQDYVHRVGRTARNGREGWAVSFVTERDVELVQGIEEHVGVKMEELTYSEEKVLEKLNTVSAAKRVATMSLHDGKFEEREERNRAKAAATTAGKPSKKAKRKAAGKTGHPAGSSAASKAKAAVS